MRLKHSFKEDHKQALGYAAVTAPAREPMTLLHSSHCNDPKIAWLVLPSVPYSRTITE